MLSLFKKLLGNETLLDKALEDTIRMLDFDQQMYVDSQRTLRQTDSSVLPYDFKEADSRVNEFEHEVRRAVLSHLAVSNRPDIVPGLALVTIVVDVERVGDYTKNIADLARNYPGRLDAGSFEADLAEIEDYIGRQFSDVIDILKTQDSARAKKAVADERHIAGSSESIIRRVIAGDHTGLEQRESTCLALYARYLKRINAHLTNVASSVANPFPLIGFRQQ